MAEITASKVKELRDRTGAGMMDCKEALQASEGDLDEAIVFLRKKMGNKLERREGRSAAEGVIATYIAGNVVAIVELNSETDFVARNDDFKALARELAQQVVVNGGDSTEAILAQDSLNAPGTTVQARLQDVFTKLRENIVFKRFERVDAGENGAVSAYVHVPANDKIGVVVELGDVTDATAAQALGKELAMHIAAASPRYLSRADVPAEVVAQESDIAATQAKNDERPEAAIPKIIEGRVKKFYEETVLLEQASVRDPKKSVSQVVKETAPGVTVRRFTRYTVGEGAKPASEE